MKLIKSGKETTKVNCGRDKKDFYEPIFQILNWPTKFVCYSILLLSNILVNFLTCYNGFIVTLCLLFIVYLIEKVDWQQAKCTYYEAKYHWWRQNIFAIKGDLETKYICQKWRLGDKIYLPLMETWRQNISAINGDLETSCLSAFLMSFLNDRVRNSSLPVNPRR